MRKSDVSVAGIGVDILERERVQRIPDLRRFAEFFLTDPELQELDTAADPIGFVASRFAAKEAVIKACPFPVGPHDFAVVKDGRKPTVRFLPPREDYAAFVSLSHSTKYVAGYAIVIECA